MSLSTFFFYYLTVLNGKEFLLMVCEAFSLIATKGDDDLELEEEVLREA